MFQNQRTKVKWNLEYKALYLNEKTKEKFDLFRCLSFFNLTYRFN